MTEEPLEPHPGPYVVLASDPLGYRVHIEPPMAVQDLARTYREKDDAWVYMRLLCCALRLPLRDLTEHNAARWAESVRREKSESSF